MFERTFEELAPAVFGDGGSAVDVLSLAICFIQRNRVQENSVVQEGSIFITL